MSRIPLFLLLFLPWFLPAQTAQYCISGRFAETPYFDSSEIRVERGIAFSFPRRWPGTGTDTLRMDVYMPDTLADPLQQRPCIVFFFGGAWLTGSRNDAGIRQKCHEWARRGFVAIAPSYRLGWNCLASDLLTVCLLCQGIYYDMNTAVYRGAQDARAAFRYIHHNAGRWQIDTNAVWAGGESAGSINALHAANWTPAYARKVFNGGPYRILGALDSAGALPGQSFRLQGLINHCGAVVSDTAMPYARLPLVQFHDAGDCVVPYRNDRILACCATSFFFARGSFRLHEQSLSTGAVSELHTVPGAAPQHCSYPSLALVQESSCFIKRNFCAKASSSSQTYPTNPPVSCSALQQTSARPITALPWSIQPNPAGEYATVSGLPDRAQLCILDLNGQRLQMPLEAKDGACIIPVRSLSEGIYFLQVESGGQVYHTRLLVQHGN